ncbi:MAG: response regulator transcription factor, partial [Chloroflexi bacterium]|nr:response regulator transcription factor [Chloroflexota bacterium]
TFDDDAAVFEGLKAGAIGYLLKDIPADELAEAIRAAARGESSLTPSVARKVVQEFTRLAGAPASATARPSTGPQTPLPDGLSEREVEVLRLAAQGLSNREIGERLFIAEGTVKNHISNILSKLQLRDRVQAVLYAREHGLLGP